MGPVADGPRVFIATPMYGGMAAGTYTMSLAHTPAAFFRNGIGLFYSVAMNDSLVPRARNFLTAQFLSSTATHLMWIDADIGFDPADIVKMVRADKDIVCGIYPKKEIHWREVARAANDGVPAERLHEYERSFVLNLIDNSPERVTAEGLIEIANAGTGFMLIKRGVFEALADDAPSYVDGSTPGMRAQGVLRRQHRPRLGKQPAVRGLPLLQNGARPWHQDLCGSLGPPEPHRYLHLRESRRREPRRRVAASELALD